MGRFCIVFVFPCFTFRNLGAGVFCFFSCRSMKKFQALLPTFGSFRKRRPSIVVWHRRPKSSDIDISEPTYIVLIWGIMNEVIINTLCILWIVVFTPPHACIYVVNHFRTAVPFWGQTIHIPSNLSPERDCGSEGVKSVFSSCLLHYQRGVV